ncbi:MAG: ABC transporter permease [Bacteroidota bacterium]
MSTGPRSATSGKSPGYYARRRFLRNYPAVAGLIWLVLCVLVAIFAYPLMPDDTENANFQVVELPKRPPGTSATLLLQPIFLEQAEPGGLSYLISGRPDRSRPVVVNSRESVVLEDDRLRYVDLRGVTQTELLPVFLLDLDKYAPAARAWQEEFGKPYRREGDEVEYVDRTTGAATASLAELKARFVEEHLVERTFVLGTDGFGRDVLSRLLLGTRVSMAVGLMAVIVSLLLGISLGAVAGFFRGRVDTVVMWFVSVVWSIPTLLLAISISFALGEGLWQLFLAIGASTWVEVARIVRGQIFTVREMQYVEATRAMGFGNFRTIVRHILPNVFGPLIIIAAANFAAAILIEAGLSFLGVGIQAPAPSWGSMIKEGYTQVMFESGAWLAIFPGIAIILVVISLNLVGFGLRDALDPKYEK